MKMKNGHDDSPPVTVPQQFPVDEKLVPPTRAIKLKGDQLRQVIRNGTQLDWVDIHARFVDLWQEARLVIWRSKHARPGEIIHDPKTGREVQTYKSDDRMVLAAIDTTRSVLDSIVKVRREMGQDRGGIPRWAIERIERALRDYPEAQHALLKELAGEAEKVVEQLDGEKT